jgi:hypothetical protein
VVGECGRFGLLLIEIAERCGADVVAVRGEWGRALDAARAPLGALERRALRDARAVSELPGAPDGEYVVFQFDAAFARKRAAVETVTPMRDVDGRWRVSGYFIR